MIKNVYSDGKFITATKTEVFGGIDLQFHPGFEITELLQWWAEWKHVFQNKNPAVIDALQQAKVLHELSK